MSSTVTVAVQVAELPFISVAVKVTVLPPKLAQEKLLGVTLKLAIPQASLEPPSIWAAVIDPVPLSSNCTVIFWH